MTLSPLPIQYSRGKRAAPGSPGLIFPACMISFSAASSCLYRKAWLQSEYFPIPQECFGIKLFEFINKHREVKGSGMGKDN